MLQEINIHHLLLQLKSFFQQDFLYLAQISGICSMVFLIHVLYTGLFSAELCDKAILDPVLLFQVKQIIGTVELAVGLDVKSLFQPK